MAYATVDELAAALRVTLTAANTDGLQACLDAAAIEIDGAVDWATAPTYPIELPPDPLLNRVNIVRGVEWFKANDAAFGVIGFADTGALQAPRNTFARHAVTLTVRKEQFGVA